MPRRLSGRVHARRGRREKTVSRHVISFRASVTFCVYTSRMGILAVKRKICSFLRIHWFHDPVAIINGSKI